MKATLKPNGTAGSSGRIFGPLGIWNKLYFRSTPIHSPHLENRGDVGEKNEKVLSQRDQNLHPSSWAYWLCGFEEGSDSGPV